MKEALRRLAAVAVCLAIGALALLEAARAARRAAAGHWDEAKDILRPLDKGIAGARGWGMDHTVSAQCGTPARAGCRYCRVVCRLAGLLDPGHCEQAARREVGPIFNNSDVTG